MQVRIRVGRDLTIESITRHKPLIIVMFNLAAGRPAASRLRSSSAPSGQEC